MPGETGTSNHRVNHEANPEGVQLMEGEKVLQNRRPGWSLWWKQILLALLVLFGGLSGEAPIAGLVGAALIFGYVVFARSKSRYIITNERIKGKVGFLSSKAMEYRIADLRSIATKQRIFDRIFGHGTLEFEAGANNRLTWHGVPDYEAVAHSARQKQRDYE